MAVNINRVLEHFDDDFVCVLHEDRVNRNFTNVFLFIVLQRSIWRVVHAESGVWFGSNCSLTTLTSLSSIDDHAWVGQSKQTSHCEVVDMSRDLSVSLAVLKRFGKVYSGNAAFVINLGKTYSFGTLLSAWAYLCVPLFCTIIVSHVMIQ